MRNKLVFAAVFAISAAVTLVITAIRSLALDAPFFTPWIAAIFFGVYAAVLAVVTIVFARERESGTYVCPDCGEEFSPSATQRVLSIRVGESRYMKCPGCGERTPCRLKKDTEGGRK